MAWNFYFKDRTGAQNGPVTLDELTQLTRSGRIAPDCLVWSEGGEPKPARSHPAISGLFTERAVSGVEGAGPLETSFPVWGLFWRAIVFVFGTVLILPAPWVGLWFYRFIAEHVALPGNRRLRLESSLGESWWIFAGLGLAAILGEAPGGHGSSSQVIAQVLSMVLSVWLTVRLFDWFCRSLRAESGKLSLTFEGSPVAYFGWVLLFSFSILTIIGWAWVLKYQLRWLCRNVVGTHGFEFVGSGLELLWRCVVLSFSFALLLPAPWVLRWFVGWYASQIVARPAT